MKLKIAVVIYRGETGSWVLVVDAGMEAGGLRMDAGWAGRFSKMINQLRVSSF